jgi:hypothetical protein
MLRLLDVRAGFNNRIIFIPSRNSRTVEETYNICSVLNCNYFIEQDVEIREQGRRGGKQESYRYIHSDTEMNTNKK